MVQRRTMLLENWLISHTRTKPCIEAARCLNIALWLRMSWPIQTYYVIASRWCLTATLTAHSNLLGQVKNFTSLYLIFVHLLMRDHLITVTELISAMLSCHYISQDMLPTIHEIMISIPCAWYSFVKLFLLDFYLMRHSVARILWAFVPIVWALTETH